MTPPWVRPMVGLVSSQPLGTCVECRRVVHTARHPEGYLSALLPACDAHEAAADAMLRDPNNWTSK